MNNMKKILSIMFLIFLMVKSFGQTLSTQANGILIYPSLDSVGQLATLSPSHLSYVTVNGFYISGDGGGGLFYWDDTSTATPVQGIIIQIGSQNPGRWIRRIEGYAFNALWFGAKRMTAPITTNASNDSVTDNAPIFRIARSYISSLYSTGGILYYPNGYFRFADSVAVPQGLTVEGMGQFATVFYADMKAQNSLRIAGYRSLFMCYGGGSGGTGLPPVIVNSFGYINLKNFGIVSSFSSGGGVTPLHFTMKNGVELRNGFFRMENVWISGGDSSGVFAYELIQNRFDNIRVDSAVTSGFHLSFDPKAPTNTSTTTEFHNCYFRQTRNGPGLMIDGPVISTAWYDCLYEENGKEDSVAGWGVQVLGDSSKTSFTNYSIRGLSFYTCDFERNYGGKLMGNYATLYLSPGCRFAGTPAVGQPDFYFRNCAVDFRNQEFKGNQQFTTNPSVVISNTSVVSSNAVLKLPQYLLEQVAFLDGTGTSQPYNWMQSLELQCLNNNGVGVINYYGKASIETYPGFSFSASDTSAVCFTSLLIGTNSTNTAQYNMALDIQSTNKFIGIPRTDHTKAVSINLLGSRGGVVYDSTLDLFLGSNATNLQPFLRPNSSGNTAIGLSTGSSPKYKFELGPSGGTGFITLNQATDDSVNYSQMRIQNAGSNWQFLSYVGGTGTQQGIQIGLNGGNAPTVTLSTSQTGFGGKINLGSTTAVGAMASIGDGNTVNNSSSIGTVLSIDPTINGSGTANTYGLFIAPYYQATGSGNQYLSAMGTSTASHAAGTVVLKHTIDTSGNVVQSGSLTIGNTPGSVATTAVLAAIDTSTGKVVKGWKFSPTNPIWAAGLLQGFTVDAGAPTLGNILYFNSSNHWTPASIYTAADTTHGPGKYATQDWARFLADSAAAGSLKIVGGPGITATNNSGVVTVSQTRLDTTMNWTSDATNSSTSVSAVYTQSSNLISGKTYAIDAFLRVGASSTNGGSFSVSDGASSSTMNVTVFGNSSSATAYRNENVPQGTSTTTGFVTYAGQGFIEIKGTVTMNANTTLIFGFLSGNSSNTVTVYSLGSYVKIRQIN